MLSYVCFWIFLITAIGAFHSGNFAKGIAFLFVTALFRIAAEIHRLGSAFYISKEDRNNESNR